MKKLVKQEAAQDTTLQLEQQQILTNLNQDSPSMGDSTDFLLKKLDDV